MTNNKQRIVAEFKKCPVCKSTRRFADSVAAEQREKGLMGDDVPAGVWEFAGPIFDPRRADKMLAGSMIPGIRVVTDVCLDCGTMYAVRLLREDFPLQFMKLDRPPGGLG